MKLYSAKIRLDGSMLNEVLKDELTAAEIVLLRVLHGQESVLDITHTANVKQRSDRRERERLAGIYSFRDENGVLTGQNLVMKYLGAPGVPLPQEVEVIEVEPEEPEVIETTEVEEIVKVTEPVAVRTTRIPRKPREEAHADALTG